MDSLRMNIRNFFMVATEEELRKEIEVRSQGSVYDKRTVPYLQELLDELIES